MLGSMTLSAFASASPAIPACLLPACTIAVPEQDLDQDGWADPDDCDDTNPNVYPGAAEIQDGIDNNCDGEIDEGLALDGDGYIAFSDCNENGRIDSCEIADDPSLDCNGNALFDLCEIVYGLAEDCDQNGVPDSCAQYSGVDVSSDRLTPFGYTSPQTWTIDPAFPGIDGAFSTARLTMRVHGDFAGPGEYFTVYVNGRFAGNVEGGGIYDCNAGPLSTSDFFTRELEIPMNVWNYAAAAGGGVVAIDFVPSIAVDTNRCAQPKPSFIEADLSYTAALDADCNANGLLDICEIDIAPWIDINSNGVPDECEGNGTISTGCPGDLDRSGQVDPGDIALLLLEMNTPAAPGDPLDVDQSGMVDPGAVGFLLLLFGPCS
jgi:hypothetical protein